jgi:PII-like signaling protein
MLHPGPAKKVTIHLNEDTAAERDFLYNEIFSFLFAHDVAGANVVRPDASFGAHHRVHQPHLGPGPSQHMPVRIEFIESPEKVEGLMPELCALLSDGLIEAHDTIIYKSQTGQEPPV